MIALFSALIVSGVTVAAPPKTVATFPHMTAQQVDVSADGNQVFVSGTGAPDAIVDAKSGAATPASAAPAWAADYWRWKSGRANPANPSELIAIATGTDSRVTAPDVGVGALPSAPEATIVPLGASTSLVRVELE